MDWNKDRFQVVQHKWRESPAGNPERFDITICVIRRETADVCFPLRTSSRIAVWFSSGFNPEPQHLEEQSPSSPLSVSLESFPVIHSRSRSDFVAYFRHLYWIPHMIVAVMFPSPPGLNISFMKLDTWDNYVVEPFDIGYMWTRC